MQNVKTRLETITGKKVIIGDRLLKTHVQKLDHIDIYNLDQFNNVDQYPNVKDILIKRSGTGLTIIINLK